MTPILIPSAASASATRRTTEVLPQEGGPARVTSLT